MTHMAFGDTKIKCAVSRGLGEGRRRTCLDNETSLIWDIQRPCVGSDVSVPSTRGPVRAGMAMGKMAMGQDYGLFRDSLIPRIFTC